MKIQGIELVDNKKVGNLKLDFSNNGEVQDTIILAGNNGCGKTTILDEISVLTTKDKWLYNDNRNMGKIIARIVPSEEEKKIVIDKLLSNMERDSSIDNCIEIFRDSNILELNVDFFKESHTYDRIKIFSIQDEQKIEINAATLFIYGDFEKVMQSFYSTANINYNFDNISSITNIELDKKNVNSIVTGNDIGTEIKQTFIDIQNLDAQDFQNWMDDNVDGILDKNKIKEKMRVRTRRFENAFKYIMNEIKLESIENSANGKQVIFTRNGQKTKIDDFSTGEKQIIIRGGYLLRFLNVCQGAIILIDEPELSLHPEWQKKILQFYKKLFTDENGNQTSQIIVATHSPFIIHNSSRYNDKVIVLSKNEEDGKVAVVQKPEYYDCNNITLIKQAFNIDEFQRENKVLFTEGETDKQYLEKAIDLYFPNKVSFNTEWIGRYNNAGKAENTGYTALNGLLKIMQANEAIMTNKVGLLYDNDTNKEEYKSNKYFTYTLKQIPDRRYKIGIENLLELPQDFPYEDYVEQKIKEDEYGSTSYISELSKTKLCDDICSSPNAKEYLVNLQRILMEIDEKMKQDD